MGGRRLLCIRSRPLGSPWRAACGVASPPNAFGVGFDIGDPGRGWESSLTSEEGVRDGDRRDGLACVRTCGAGGLCPQSREVGCGGRGYQTNPILIKPAWNFQKNEAKNEPKCGGSWGGPEAELGSFGYRLGLTEGDWRNQMRPRHWGRSGSFVELGARVSA
jgi:hypothetical protein